MKARELMHTRVAWVASDAPIRHVAAIMRDNDVGAVPVHRDGRLVGIITDRDITTRAVADGKDTLALCAKHIMSRRVHSCRDTADVLEVLELMHEKKVRRLPVIDARKKLVGMISLGDISDALPPFDSGKLLQSVSAHHR